MNCPGPKGTQDYCNSSVVADMFGGYTTSGDLFDLVWRGGGRSLELEERAGSCLRFSPQFEPPVEEHVPEVPPGLPSENEMATWLYAIVKGEDHAYGDGNGGRCTDNDGWHAPLEKSSETSTDTAEATSLEKKIEKVPTAEVTDTATKETGSQSSKTRKQTAGMRSHHGVKHKLTEKRRRCKINEKLKTLQHLVPGCDKSNYTSTLEHTIQYMKSLQQKVQALGGSTSPPAAAVRPVVQPRYVSPGPPVTLAPMVVLGPHMVPMGSVLPLPHYPSSVMMMPAATKPLYVPTPSPRFAPAASSLGQGMHRVAACAGKGKRS